MTDKRVLRFEGDEGQSHSIVVYTTSAGPKPLDLSLVASEGAYVYVTTCK
jgi:hypothetical protein